MRPGSEPTAEGDVGQTPFAQILAFAFERGLTGSLFLGEPQGDEHIVAFDRGAPVKVRSSDTFARLGGLLVDDGALDLVTLEQALATPGLLGDVLLVGEAVTSRALDQAVDRQFVQRMRRLFVLSADTTWAFYEGHGALDDWGGEPSRLDPLAVLWGGVREHAEALAPSIDATLARLGDAPVRASASAPADRLGFDDEERQALELLQLDATPLAQAAEVGLVPEPVLRRVLYGLLLTRSLVGLDSPAPAPAPADAEAPPSSVSAPRSAPSASPADEASSVAKLGRMQLRATLHRDGAAAPDAPGDGERVPIAPRRPKRDAADPARRRLPATEAFALASDRAAARAIGGAIEAIDDALAADPDNPDYRAFAAWLRGEQPQADVKAIAIDLDELVAAHVANVPARYYRAVLRLRLSNTTGAASDLRRVLELDPAHAAAQKLLASIAQPDPPAPKGGLFARLFLR